MQATALMAMGEAGAVLEVWWALPHEAPSVLKMSRFDVTSPTGVPDVTWSGLGLGLELGSGLGPGLGLMIGLGLGLGPEFRLARSAEATRRAEATWAHRPNPNPNPNLTCCHMGASPATAAYAVTARSRSPFSTWLNAL